MFHYERYQIKFSHKLSARTKEWQD